MRFDEVRAQPTAVETLRRALRSSRIAQAYLFDGPSGVGKQRAALALATEALCPDGGCEKCEVCRRITANNHPDVRVFPPREDGARNIAVDFLRKEVLPVAQFAPFEAKMAFLIFPEADVSFPVQHSEAANALLKTLEEPRPGVHFILLAERPDRLLPTIRSRCQRVRFGRLPPLALDKILEDANVHAGNRDLAVALADGRADCAFTLAEKGAGETLIKLAMRIDQTIDEAHAGGLTALAEELSRGEELGLVLETLATWYRDVAAAALGADEGTLAFRHVAHEVRSRASKLSPDRAAARVELIRLALEELEANANAQILLDSLFFELRGASWSTTTSLPRTLLPQPPR